LSKALRDLFYYFLVLDEGSEAHRLVALGQVMKANDVSKVNEPRLGKAINECFRVWVAWAKTSGMMKSLEARSS
jgi:hypothetical protein